ncbi:MAG: anhydro-N-acetylmuramic acid kinase [Clostridia bacterium]|nr:anhydro-N-acetylmuramic acid kinase [Clostridia bacterium]
MHPLQRIREKESLLVIGLMSGTSADGMDAALAEITGAGLNTRVKPLGFVSLSYPAEIREEILRLASGDAGGSRDLCLFHFLLGELSLEACRAVCRQTGVSPEQIDLVGSHGQTLYHAPAAESYLGRPVRGTLQLGEASVICEGLGCPVVSDFRVRDLAARGQGAPLVPYAEYLLYRQADRSVGLQNIGGIGNLTVLPAGGAPEDTFAFDTGPGNMVIDQLISRMTGGEQRYDADGRIAASGRISEALLSWMLDDEYLRQPPPKTTGRERYGKAYVDALTARGDALGLTAADLAATATRFTAACVLAAYRDFCPVKPDELIIGGGGSRNPTLLRFLRDLLPIPVRLNEELGFDSEAKEAIAFAILASECVHGCCNNVPSVTGASHPVVMGKISL